jgi:hypothetical protein
MVVGDKNNYKPIIKKDVITSFNQGIPKDKL